MSDLIEKTDRKRRRVLRTYIIGALSNFACWMTRFILHETGALPEWLDVAIAVPFAASMALLLYSFYGLLSVRKAMAANPDLKAALNDERVELNNLIAFKYGFFAILGGLAFFAAFNFLSPVKDFYGVILTLFMLGSWAYLFAFYRLEKD
jgi:hypothetical protein